MFKGWKKYIHDNFIFKSLYYYNLESYDKSYWMKLTDMMFLLRREISERHRARYRITHMASRHTFSFKWQPFKCHSTVSLLWPSFPCALHTSFISSHARLSLSASLSGDVCLYGRVAICISSFIFGSVSDTAAILSVLRLCLSACLSLPPLLLFLSSWPSPFASPFALRVPKTLD